MSNDSERTDSGRRRRQPEAEEINQLNGNGLDGGAEPSAGYTGRYLVLFVEGEGAAEAGIRALRDSAGIRAVSAAEMGPEALTLEALGTDEGVVFPQLNVAVVNAPPAHLRQMGTMAARDTGIVAMERERWNFVSGWNWGSADALPTLYGARASAPTAAGVAPEYLRAYQAGVNATIDQALGTAGLTAGTTAAAPVAAAPLAETDFTWGLQVTGVTASRFSGRGVKVAVLDTGIDLDHPDFIGRNVVAQSFIAGQAVQDGHGHGTHCAGTACGPEQPSQLPRYGVAYSADLFVGKVLSNQGSGTDGQILAGIDWAITNGCAIVSMSLGAPTVAGQSFSRVFETVAQRALAKGTLIVAAAGNESARPGTINPVAHPANCPSILAVAALDSQLQVAFFSCGGVNPQGGQVDISGPGVAVRSAWPRPTLYRTINGTSMATPHVAGIAALHIEAQQGVMTGGVLGWLLLQSARRLTLPGRDVGVGLVQAP